jgi:hypothetical protein
VLLCSPPSAGAQQLQPPSPVEEDSCRTEPRCAALDIEGYAHYESEDYARALAAWEAAQAIRGVPRLWLCQGRAQFRLGRCKQAEQLYLRYLSEEPSGGFAPKATEWLAELRTAPACAILPVSPPLRLRRRLPVWPWLLGSGAVAAVTLGVSLGLAWVPYHRLIWTGGAP